MVVLEWRVQKKQQKTNKHTVWTDSLYIRNGCNQFFMVHWFMDPDNKT